MSGEPYIPHPVDTSQISLAELQPLLEALARNAHEIWAQKRLQDGWTYGPQRDDAQRTHPCLVPYEQLPESEKEYDRVLVNETLKTILALGYRITKR
ncbi:MAG: RyR domain-containing protein [Candidatus Acidiferrales bacterium]